MAEQKTALISVSNKSGIIEFAHSLVACGYRLLATGGSAAQLIENNIDVIEVSDYTEFPEIMGGRVKTLHPKIFAGILRRNNEDNDLLQQHDIDTIDLVVINLYPFETVISKPNCPFEKAIENIDIGGPSLIRAAAKNHAHVSVIVDPDDYQDLISHLEHNGQQVSDQYKLSLAQKAFAYSARYEATIANYMNSIDCGNFPKVYTTQFIKKADLRYGENPQQQAALYYDHDAGSHTLAQGIQIQGKECSYNNLADSESAWECVQLLANKACVIVKHANPCGVASHDNLLDAYAQAFASDPQSAFGGIIAFNDVVDGALATQITENQFAEVIIAPDFSEQAKQVFASKPALRLLCIPPSEKQARQLNFEFKRIDGGLLLQTKDLEVVSKEQLEIVTEKKPSVEQIEDMMFAWQVVKMVKSNAIVLASNKKTIGIGAGQMSRIFSAQIAIERAKLAGLSLSGAVMASDAFLPFPDTVELAAKEGILAIIQTGGSKRDNEAITAANAAGIAMIFTGVRHFKH